MNSIIKFLILILIIIFSSNCVPTLNSRNKENNNENLKSIFPSSIIEPRVEVTYDKNIDLLNCCERLAIVGITSSFDPSPSINDSINTVKIVLEGFERNLLAFGFTLLERGKINKIIEELSLSLSGLMSEENAIQIGRLLNAKAICLIDIVASYSNPNQKLFKVSFKIIETETGRIVVTGTQVNTIDGIAKMFEKLAAPLGLPLNNLSLDERKKIETRIYNYDYEKVFNAIIPILKDNDFNIIKNDKKRGIIYTDYKTIGNIRLKFNVRIKEINKESTLVKLNPEFQVFTNNSWKNVELMTGHRIIFKKYYNFIKEELE